MTSKFLAATAAALLVASLTGCAAGVPDGCKLTRDQIDSNQTNILKNIEEGVRTDFAIAFVDTELVVNNPKCFDWRVLQLSIEKLYD